MTDDTAYVQDLLDKGLPVPMGEYICPDGVTLPGDYCARARVAGRVPDEAYADREGFLLSEPPGARLNFAWGGCIILSGWAFLPLEGNGTGSIGFGKDGCCITSPWPMPVELEGAGYGVPVANLL